MTFMCDLKIDLIKMLESRVKLFFVNFVRNYVGDQDIAHNWSLSFGLRDILAHEDIFLNHVSPA